MTESPVASLAVHFADLEDHHNLHEDQVWTTKLTVSWQLVEHTGKSKTDCTGARMWRLMRTKAEFDEDMGRQTL